MTLIFDSLLRAVMMEREGGEKQLEVVGVVVMISPPRLGMPGF
jgi:hypothetical protein